MKRLLQAVRFERGAFVWMDLEDRATGDALILVLVTRLVIMAGLGGSLLGLATSLSGIEVLIASLINAAVFWLAYSGLVFAITKYLLQGDGAFATILRITGFAYPTLILVIATARIFRGNGLVAVLVGAVWFFAMVTQGVRHTADLPVQKAALAAGGGFVGWIIVASIFGNGYI
jgi:hypothetical protein